MRRKKIKIVKELGETKLRKIKIKIKKEREKIYFHLSIMVVFVWSGCPQY